jgi:hypothetical protein
MFGGGKRLGYWFQYGITSAVGDDIEVACHPDQLADGGGSG